MSYYQVKSYHNHVTMPTFIIIIIVIISPLSIIIIIIIIIIANPSSLWTTPSPYNPSSPCVYHPPT